MSIPSVRLFKKQMFSWGRVKPRAAQCYQPTLRKEILEYVKMTPNYLPVGLRRSYGDSCLHDELLQMETFNRFIHFDREKGVLRCEAGVSLAEILAVILPAGWFLPVTPGTKFVTLGGAIANDVHGKNHHSAGTFGCHVRALELARSDGSVQVCTPTEHSELFRATIGGLGLTGVMIWAEIQLLKAGSVFETEDIKFQNVDEFFSLCEEPSESYPYIVSWIDSFAKGEELGRGIFMRGRHVEAQEVVPVPPKPLVSVPFELGPLFLNRYSMKVFNELMYGKQRQKKRSYQTYIEPYFYPLDKIGHWNLIYGKKGFYQYQLVVPLSEKEAIREVMRRVSGSGQGSFLSVLKKFGDRPSPGMLSFPMSGYTLTFDLANLGARTLRLFDDLDAIVSSAGGRLYPAKDARTSQKMFQEGFPLWQEFLKHKDPKARSDFGARVGLC